jgi:hypothetical protein
MAALRIEAILTWIYAAGFGGCTIPVAVYLRRHGRLPRFFDLFEMYGGRWSARFGQDAFVLLLLAFLAVTLAASWAAWLVWNASTAGGVLMLAVLPVEAVFWFGFNLPIPKAVGVARVVLLALGWTSLH